MGDDNRLPPEPYLVGHAHLRFTDIIIAMMLGIAVIVFVTLISRYAG